MYNDYRRVYHSHRQENNPLQLNKGVAGKCLSKMKRKIREKRILCMQNAKRQDKQGKKAEGGNAGRGRCKFSHLDFCILV